MTKTSIYILILLLRGPKATAVFNKNTIDEITEHLLLYFKSNMRHRIINGMYCLALSITNVL